MVVRHPMNLNYFWQIYMLKYASQRLYNFQQVVQSNRSIVRPTMFLECFALI